MTLTEIIKKAIEDQEFTVAVLENDTNRQAEIIAYDVVNYLRDKACEYLGIQREALKR